MNATKSGQWLHGYARVLADERAQQQAARLAAVRRETAMKAVNALHKEVDMAHCSVCGEYNVFLDRYNRCDECVTAAKQHSQRR